MRLALTTGGGDAPGLNAAIKAVVMTALEGGDDVLGIRCGYDGLLGDEGVVELDRAAVRGIAHRGGTIIGTTNHGNPFAWPVETAEGSVERDRSDELVAALTRQGVDALVAIGGDGSLAIAAQLANKGVNVVGIPKTIDNDVGGTVHTFGFNTAVFVATQALDRLHSTAEAHRRVLVVEVMGRHAGWIALHAGIAGSADVILLPEIEYSLDSVCAKVSERERMGRRFSIVVVAEGACPVAGHEHYVEPEHAGHAARLGGIAEIVADGIERGTGKETRTVVLGHLQRGGPPTSFDRLLALRFGAAAVRAARQGAFGTMVSYQPPEVTIVPLAEAVGPPRQIPLGSDTVATARDLGICLGD
ncbi:MAG: 6-phosphofructokinase [Gaiellaceae bacterium]